MNEPHFVYDSPLSFSFNQRLALAIVPPVAARALKILYATCTVEVQGIEHWDRLFDDGRHFLLAFWHESMGLAACYFRNTGFHTLTSYSYDGEMAARVVNRFGMKALRGSSSRGGMRALQQLEAAARHFEGVGYTLDGPRGPRRVAKPGMPMISATTQFPIVPFAATLSRAWRLNSWDRFPVPKPFSKAIFAFGPQIPPPSSSSRDDIQGTRLRLDEELNALHARIEKEANADPGLAK